MAAAVGSSLARFAALSPAASFLLPFPSTVASPKLSFCAAFRSALRCAFFCDFRVAFLSAFLSALRAAMFSSITESSVTGMCGAADDVDQGCKEDAELLKNS